MGKVVKHGGKGDTEVGGRVSGKKKQVSQVVVVCINVVQA